MFWRRKSIRKKEEEFRGEVVREERKKDKRDKREKRRRRKE